MSEVPFASNITSRVLVNILDELNQVENPFVGMRVHIKEIPGSVIIDEVSERKKVTGYSSVIWNGVDSNIQEMFPVKVTYDFYPKEVQKVGTSVQVRFANFKATVDGVETSIKSVKINGTEIGQSFTETLTVTKTYNITVETENNISFQERVVKFLKGISIGFSSVDDPRTVNVNSLLGLFDPDGLFLTNTAIVNQVSRAYLWIISPFVPKYVKETGPLEIAIEGTVLLQQGGLVYWRSNDLLNSGDWIINVR